VLCRGYHRSKLHIPTVIAGKDTPSPLVRGQIEGWVRVRIAGSTDWKKLWMVVSRGQDHPPSAVSTDTRQSAPNSPKRRISNMFRRESRAALALVLTKCQIAFYASHKPKDKRETLLTLHNVLQAYAVYPERPELINMSTLMKLEGQFGGEDMAGMRKTREGWLYVMPDLDGGFGTAREMLAWLIGRCSISLLVLCTDQFLNCRHSRRIRTVRATAVLHVGSSRSGVSYVCVSNGA
jgi:CCR4-NOT transcriptional complex subunit CAF120